MKPELRKVRDVLQEIDNYFCDGGQSVGAYSLLFEDDRPLREHVTEALSIVREILEPEPIAPAVPRSQRKYIWQNQFGNWNGYCGKRRVEQFGRNECLAKIWLDQFPPEERRD